MSTSFANWWRHFSVGCRTNAISTRPPCTSDKNSEPKQMTMIYAWNMYKNKLRKYQFIKNTKDSENKTSKIYVKGLCLHTCKFVNPLISEGKAAKQFPPISNTRTADCRDQTASGTFYTSLAAMNAHLRISWLWALGKLLKWTNSEVLNKDVARWIGIHYNMTKNGREWFMLWLISQINIL